jgi:hypothetical protein
VLLEQRIDIAFDERAIESRIKLLLRRQLEIHAAVLVSRRRSIGP